MANNKTGKDAAGTTFTYATDDVTGVDYPVVKLAVGTEDAATRIAAGGGTEATALRVTLASDSTGVVSVDDNGSTISIDDGGGSITVDGTLTIDDGGNTISVGGATVIITPAITVTAGAYSAGDVVGGEITLTNAMRVTSGSGVIQSLTVETANGATPALTFMFFDSDPAANTADNGAFAWGAGDIARWLGKVDVATADYATLGGDGVVTKTGIGLAVAASGTANLYLYIICTGTPTFAATSDLVVRVGILQD